MNVNENLEMEKIIDELVKEGKTPSILLHSCCGPCSSCCIERLADYFNITIYYYNPNIYPEEEYFLGKSLDGSCPMGPYLVTKDEIPDPQKLTVVTKVNDEVRQNGTTAQMMHTVEDLIVEISSLVTLEPGDVILTGTPAGVGKGMTPPQFLKAGDTVKVSIEGIGTLVNRFE